MSQEAQGSVESTSEQAPEAEVQQEEQVEEVKAEGEELQESESEELTEEEIQAAEESLSEEEKDLIDELVLKVDGKEVVKKLPFKVSKEHVDYIRKQEQLAAVAQKRMQEAAMLKKQNEDVQGELKEFFSRLRGDDGDELLAELLGGETVEAMAKRVLQKKLAEAEKSPEQLAAEKAEKERQNKIKELEEKLKAKEEAERKMKEDQQAKEIEEGIISAIESQGLPSDPRVISRFAQAMRAGVKYGVDLKPEEVAPIIKNQMYEDAKFQLSSLSDDELENMLGKDRITSLRKNFISRIRKSVPSKNQIKDTGEKSKEKPFQKKSKQRVKAKDLFKELESKFS